MKYEKTFVSFGRQQLTAFRPGRFLFRCVLGRTTLTDQSGQRAVRDRRGELDDDEVLVLSELLDLHTFLRHHVQLLQGVGLLRVPDRSNHIWYRTGNEICQCLLEEALK